MAKGSPKVAKVIANKKTKKKRERENAWYNEHGSLSQFHMAVLCGAGQRLEVHGSTSQCTSLEVHRSA